MGSTYVGVLVGNMGIHIFPCSLLRTNEFGWLAKLKRESGIPRSPLESLQSLLYWDNGKENGNYYNGESNGKENGK